MAQLARTAEKMDKQEKAGPNYLCALVVSGSAQHTGQSFRDQSER
jgi:hypothetical protein